jgi:hypothetical protein
LDCSGVEWSGVECFDLSFGFYMEWSGVEWSVELCGLDCIGAQWSGVDFLDYSEGV